MRAHGKPFFDRMDWVAFWVATVVAFAVYVLSLGPSVGLEDSGELVTAAVGLGVPHPPGYPLWTLLSWCFCKLFGWVTWQGWPTPAWAVALGSATMGALAVGVTALLIVRSGRDLLTGAAKHAGEWWVTASAWVGGVAAALAFAFSPVMWSQAVIVEVYALGAFFLALTMLLTYQWIRQPRTSTLVWLGLVFGLGLTNYQVLLLAALPIGLAIFVRRWRLGLSFVAVGVPLGLTLCLLALDAGKMSVGGALAAHAVGIAALWAVCWRFRRMRRFAAVMTVIQTLGLVAITGRVLAWDLSSIPLPLWWTFVWDVAALSWNPMLLLGQFWGIFAWDSVALTWEPALTSWRFWWPFVWDVAILALAWRLVLRGRCVALTLLTVQLGLAFYLYMPIASSFGPAMDWGYTREWAGFSRAVMRGQYEALAPSDWLSVDYLRQLWRYLCDLCLQFSVPVVLFGAVGTTAIAGIWRRNRRGLLWLGCTALLFVMMSALLVALANPTGDLQDDFVQKVKFISSYGIFALWLGYGLSASMVFLRRWRWAWGGGVALACLAVAAPLIANFTDDDLVRRFGAAEQTGHDFGWQFGAYMLEGAPAIRAELADDEEPLPDPFWPPPMEQGAILFGGTDPGRFVPTYMVHAVGYRSDVHVLTQGALADPTYMASTRNLYGESLSLPTKKEQGAIAAECLMQSGRLNDALGASVQINDSALIWQINGALARLIATRNPTRAIYVEESMRIPWMDDLLEPAGLAMRLRREGGRLGALADRDADFWDWMTRRLVTREAYRRDFAAKKSFSCLRAAIAGLYARHGYFDRADKAYQDAFALYPESSQVVSGIASGSLVPQGRFTEALRLIRAYRAMDPNLRGAEKVERQITDLIVRDERLRTLVNAPNLSAAGALEGFREALTLRRDAIALDFLRRVPDATLAALSEEESLFGGLMAQQHGDDAQAMRLYRAALGRFPQSPQLWLSAGLCYYNRGEYKRAYDCLSNVRRFGGDALLTATPEVGKVFQWLAERYEGPRKGAQQ